MDVAYLLPDIGTLFRLGDTVPHTAERRDAHRETEALGNGKLQSYFAYIKCIVTALRILRPQIIVLSVKTDLKERRLPVDSAVRSGVEGVYRYRRPESESYAAHGTRKRRVLRHDVAYAVIGIRRESIDAAALRGYRQRQARQQERQYSFIDSVFYPHYNPRWYSDRQEPVRGSQISYF